MAILLWHLVWGQIPPSVGAWAALHLVLSQTWSGVDLFFVLSGFLILNSLWDRERKGYPITSFLRARAFRLLPAYLLLLLACAAIRNLGASVSNFNSAQVLLADKLPFWAYACFGQSWYMVLNQLDLAEAFGNRLLSVTWSLAAEVEYYAGAALVLIVVIQRQRALTFAWFALLAVLVRAALTLYAPPWSVAAYVLPPARMDGFALGAMVACAFRFPSVLAFTRERISAVFALCLLLGAGVALLTLNGTLLSGGFASNFSYTWMALFYTSCLAWVVLRSSLKPISILARGPLAWLGTISYSVFLFHYPLHFLYCDLFRLNPAFLTEPHGFVYFAGDMAAILGGGAASYFAVERPFIELGRRFDRIRST